MAWQVAAEVIAAEERDAWARARAWAALNSAIAGWRAGSGISICDIAGLR